MMDLRQSAERLNQAVALILEAASVHPQITSGDIPAERGAATIAFMMFCKFCSSGKDGLSRDEILACCMEEIEFMGGLMGSYEQRN